MTRARSVTSAEALLSTGDAHTSPASPLGPPATAPSRRRPRHARWAAAAVVFLVATGLRVGLADRQGLWADELFTAAMVTGHSLEHRAEQADPALGDYVEHDLPTPPADYAAYLEHGAAPASLSRVLRALRRSDTSPPFYYVLLWGWTRCLGTGDATLRLFSIACSLACVPLLWSLARQVGGRAAPLPACALFAFVPAGLFYSTEARMYALLWLLTLACTWLTLRLRAAGPRFGWLALWTLVAAAGLLTHYFFLFVWSAACLWLLLTPRRMSRPALLAAAAVAVLLAVPWYRHLPESLSAWRVTGNWLAEPPENFSRPRAMLDLAASYTAVGGVWASTRWGYEWAGRVMTAVIVVVMFVTLRRRLVTPRRGLLWLMLAAALLGPAAFDLARNTYVVGVPRYALAGLPAAILLAAAGLARLRQLPRTALTAALVVCWLPGVRQMYRVTGRQFEPYRPLAARVAEHARDGDLVIVRSIPSGVCGIARYLQAQLDAPAAAPREIGFVSWVGQLGRRRVPDDVQRLAAGRHRVLFVDIHAAGAPNSPEPWLRSHATAVWEQTDRWSSVVVFEPTGDARGGAGGETSVPGERAAVQP